MPLSDFVISGKCNIIDAPRSWNHPREIDILFKEMEEFDIGEERLLIHPRAAIVRKMDKDTEQDKNGVIRIASTQSGSGAARASKIMRENPLAQGVEERQPFMPHDPAIKRNVIWSSQKSLISP